MLIGPRLEQSRRAADDPPMNGVAKLATWIGHDLRLLDDASVISAVLIDHFKDSLSAKEADSLTEKILAALELSRGPNFRISSDPGDSSLITDTIRHNIDDSADPIRSEKCGSILAGRIAAQAHYFKRKYLFEQGTLPSFGPVRNEPPHGGRFATNLDDAPTDGEVVTAAVSPETFQGENILGGSGPTALDLSFLDVSAHDLQATAARSDEGFGGTDTADPPEVVLDPRAPPYQLVDSEF